MPDDLLRFVTGPDPVPATWLWAAAALAVALIVWYAWLFAWTRPRTSERPPGMLARTRESVARRRFAREVRRIGERCERGEITAAAAGAELSTALRGFLQHVTGTPARYLQVDEMADGVLAPAAPILARINDVQFNDRSGEDARALSAATEELILSWS